MATSQMNGVLQHLRRAMLLRVGAGLTDGQLLKDYISRRDETALAVLVQRHGPMVWGVCHRVLRNYHDAEDAFQATFLVLVRRAASIASPELLANWLYGVAHQTAIKVRATVAKRKDRERQVTEMPEPAVVDQDLWNDLQPLLDQELSRLPDIYRVVLVLCDLQGKTRKEAARQLGLPEGTIGSRLARARRLLAKRLTERGVTLSAGVLAAVLAQNVASAGVPDSVVSFAISAASFFAAGQMAATGPVSVKVAALAEGVLKAMMISKLKAVVAIGLVLGFLVAGATVLSCRRAAAQAASEKPVTAADRVATPEKPEKEKEKDGFTAWGKEVGGLQAGLGFRPGERRAYHHGETVKLIVRVRNVGKEAIKFQYLRQFFTEKAPTVTDGKGKPVDFRYGWLDTAIFQIPVDVNLAPGKEIVLGEAELLTTLLGTGKFSVQYERVFGNTSVGTITLDPTLSKLATGKLELEVKDAEKDKDAEQPEATDKPSTAEELEAKAGDADALALPAGAVARLGSPRLRHGARLKDVAYSPNGKRIASVGYDNTLRVWDAESGRPLFAVQRPDSGFDKVSFAAEGAVIVALGRGPDKRGALWRIEAATGKVLDRLKVEATIPGSLMPEAAAVRFSPDGSRLALGSADKKQLLVIDTVKAEVIWTADLGKEVPGGVAFAPDGKTVAVATSAGRVHLFDRDGKPTAQFKTKEIAALSSVALSPDGKLVTARNSDSRSCELIAWDRAKGEVLWTQDHKGGHGLAFTPDSRIIVECGSWSFASTLDASDGLPPGNGDRKDASFPSMAEVRCLALHPSGKVVAFGTDSGTICLFDVATRKPVSPTADPRRAVERLRFSADGKTLYGWALDWLAWDVATGKQRYVTNAGGWNFNLPLSPDGKYTARALSRLGALGGTLFEICDAANGNSLYAFPGRDFAGVWFDFTPDGKGIIAFEADGSIELWSIDGEKGVRMSGHKGAPTYRAFAASAPVMVTATNLDTPENFSVRVWDLKNGKELGKFNPGVGLNKGNGYSYGSLVALSGDGKRVAALTYSNSYGKPEPKERASVWDVASGKVLVQVPQGGDSGQIALSPDGRLVAVAALWKSDVRVYEVDGGGERFHFRHAGEVTGLAFAPDGRTLAVASKEAPVYLWDVSGKKR